MAAVLVQSSYSRASAASVSVTLTAIGAGSTVILKAQCQNTALTLTFSDDKSNSYTTDYAANGVSNPSTRVTFGSKASVGNGPVTFTVSNGGFTDTSIWAEEWTGLATSSFVDQTVTAHSSSNGTAVTMNVSPTADGEAASVIVSHGDGITAIPTAGSGWTLDTNNTATDLYHGQTKVLGTSAGGPYAANMTLSASNPWDIWVVTYKAAVTASQIIVGYYPDDVFEESYELDQSPFDFYTDTTANRADVQPPIPVELPQSYEWVDPNETEEALWPDYWAQAPPILDNDVARALVWDSSDQPEYEDEDFGFADSPAQVVVAAPDQIYGDDASAQLEDEEEPFGFAGDILFNDEQAGIELSLDVQEDEFLEGFSDAPLDTGSVPVDMPFTEDGDTQLEEDEFAEGFADAPLSADLAITADQIYGDDASAQAEEDEFAEGFTDAPLPLNVIAQPDQIAGDDASSQLEEDEFLEGFTDAAVGEDAPMLALAEQSIDQPDEDEFFEGFSDTPLAEDAPMLAIVEDAGQQQDEDEFLEGFSDAAPPEDAPMLAISEGSADQPDEDEFLEGFADAPPTDPFAPDVIFPDDATNQPSDPEDEDFAFVDVPLSEDAPMLSVVEDASTQPADVDDEDFAFSLDPLSADAFDPNIVWSDTADNQIDTPDDEAFDFSIGPTPADVAPTAVFPLPSQVLAGVVYGPNGNDYVGTLTLTGLIWFRR